MTPKIVEQLHEDWIIEMVKTSMKEGEEQAALKFNIDVQDVKIAMVILEEYSIWFSIIKNVAKEYNIKELKNRFNISEDTLKMIKNLTKGDLNNDK